MNKPVTGSITPERSLEARYYTDPGIYQNELTGLFARTWQFACHASDRRKPR